MDGVSGDGAQTTSPLASTVSGRRLSVVFRLQDLLAAHSADALLVRASLAVVGADLMHLLATNSAFGKLAIRCEPGFLGRQRLVFVDHSAAAFGGVPRPSLPWIGGDHFSELLLALFAHHFTKQRKKIASFAGRVANLTELQAKATAQTSDKLLHSYYYLGLIWLLLARIL